jgi:dihydroorotate dehydrogenase (NAD+) catalytic subunit
VIGSRSGPAPDMSVSVGSVSLPNPVMTASGTAGHGLELSPFVEHGRLGAFVVKSLAAYPWAGNDDPRLHPTPGGMLNSVGLQGPGVEAWVRDRLPELEEAGARVVASIWGRSVAEYEQAAMQLADAGEAVIAVEVNLSCPNHEGGRQMFAHDAEATADAIAATAACGRPRWAKLSPNTDRLVEIAGVAVESGAEAVTLVNTLLGLVIDRDERAPVLGGGGGGLSGPAIHPVAVRAVAEVHAAHPNLAIVGVGGVEDAESAVDLFMAGADAVQGGTATVANPRAPMRVLDQLERWCRRHQVATVRELTGSLHV